MRRSTISTRRLAWLAGGALAVVTSLHADTAKASGYLTTRFGGDHGTPAMPNTFAVYFNPAALGGTKGTTITGDVSLLVRHVNYRRANSGLSPTPANSDRLLGDADYVESNTGNAKLTNLLALPFLGVNTDFGTKWLRGGYAFYIPFGGLATWSKTGSLPGVPGAEDGPQRWHNISGQILAIYNTFALAANVPDSGFSFGLSFSPVIHHVATVRARTSDDSDEVKTSNGGLKEGRSYLDVSGVNFAGSAGVYWQSKDEARVRLGLSYISQPGFGTSRLSGTLQGRTGGGDVRQDVDFLQTYPDVIRLGGTYRLPGDKVEIRTDGEFVRWSTFDKQCVVQTGKDCKINPDGSQAGGAPNDVVLNIPRNWNNSVGYRLGAAYFLNKQVELFASGAFTTSAVPKSTIDASTIDSFRLYGSIGAKLELSRKVALATSYNHIYFFDVNTRDSNIFDRQAKPSLGPSADGRYRSQIGFLNVNVAYTF